MEDTQQVVPTESVVTSEPVVTSEAMPEPEVSITSSPYIITIDELTTTQGAIIQKEIADKQALFDVFQPNQDTLKNRLVIWASLGFPSDWVVFTAKTDTPVVCSDGQVRSYYDYVLYLLGQSIQSFLDILNSQVLGVCFNFFLRDVNTIGLNVSKL